MLRAVRVAFELEPFPTDPEQLAVFALAVVVALGSLLKFPLAEPIGEPNSPPTKEPWHQPTSTRKPS